MNRKRILNGLRKKPKLPRAPLAPPTKVREDKRRKRPKHRSCMEIDPDFTRDFEERTQRSV